MRALLIWFVLVGVCLVEVDVLAGTYTVNRKAQWEEWTVPQGAVELDEDGSIRLVRFGRNIDPIANAGTFKYKSVTLDTVWGGIRVQRWPKSSFDAPVYMSNKQDSPALIDRDVHTYWKPHADDPLEDWWVEVDLGRVVLADKIRLIFPDTSGARPFRDFSVYVSEGSNVLGRMDLFRFTRVGTTTEPNKKPVVEYDLFTLDEDLATGETLVTGDTLRFAAVQYVRFVPHTKNDDAALAEIEMTALGDNIALGTLERGGTIRAGKKFETSVSTLFDGTINRYWNCAAARAAESFWREGGQWFEWNLGASFWLDKMVLLSWYPPEVGKGAFGANSGPLGYVLSTSDGSTISASGEGDRIEGNFDYELLSTVDNYKGPRRWKFDHVFPRRKVRTIFFHHESPADARYGFNWFEIMLYGGGYPAEIQMTSGFVDLGASKSIIRVNWEADTPPGTAVEVRTKTGDTLQRETIYFDKNGKQITEAIWNKLPKAARGWTEEILRQGTDWSAWTTAYVSSGEAFRSPSPRRYVQFYVTLSTEDPQVAPVLYALSLDYHEPLVRKGAQGTIMPREAEPGVLQDFLYRIQPTFTFGDVGFDSLAIQIPSRVQVDSVKIGGQVVTASDTTYGDSLFVKLPRAVTRDSVEVYFKARIFETPTMFETFLFNSTRAGVWQGIKPTATGATSVFLPSVPVDDRLIRNVSIEPQVITPNADQIHDRMNVCFDLVKVDASPEVNIYSLRGKFVKELARQEGEERCVYLWDGTDEAGTLVPPGVYLCRIQVHAEIGTQSVQRLMYVVY